MKIPLSIERQSTPASANGRVESEVQELVRVLVADDNREVLMATVDLILDSEEADVVCAASDVADAVRGAARHQPDIAFVDAWLRGGGAELATAKIRTVSPRTRVVVLASAQEAELLPRLLAAGASGCYEKEMLGEALSGVLASVRG